jgi:hypothetical protein
MNVEKEEDIMSVTVSGPGTRCAFATDAAGQIVAEVSIWKPAKEQRKDSAPEEKTETIRRTKKQVEMHEVKIEAGPAFLGAYASLFLTGGGQACVCAGKESDNACKLLFYPVRIKAGNGEETNGNGFARAGVMARCIIESLEGEVRWKSMFHFNMFDLMRFRHWARDHRPEIDVFGSFVVTRDAQQLRVRVGSGANVPLQALSADAAGYLGSIVTGVKTKGFTRDQLSIYRRDEEDKVSLVVGGMRAVVQNPAELHRLMLHFERGAHAIS